MVNGPWNIGQGQKDDSIQEAMLSCMQVPSIIAVGPIVIEKLT